VRAILVLVAAAGVTLAIVWVAGRLSSPAPAPTPAQAAANARVDRNYRRLVRRLRVRGRRVQRITAARNVWARHADRICRTFVRRAAAATATAVHAKTRNELFALLSQVEAQQTDAVRQLQALPPPRHDAAKVRTLLDLLDQAVANDQALVAALRRNDTVTAQRLTRQSQRIAGPASSIARSLGAYTCADDSIWDETS